MGGAFARRCLPEVSVILRSRTAAAYGRNVPTTVSVLSNTQVPPDQITWLLNQFEALQGSSGHDWIIDVGPGVVDVVAVADGTDDLASMPRQLLDGAAEWLGGPPQYRCADVRGLTCVQGPGVAHRRGVRAVVAGCMEQPH